VLLWTLPTKRSVWFQNFNNVDGFVAARNEAHEDVYVGVSIAGHDAKVTARTRVSNVTAAGLPGLWADIDVQDPVHRKPGLPPDVDTVLAFLTTLERQPTIIVHSGHGLQAWWLFSTPWVFQQPQDRPQAAALAQWWHSSLSQQFQARQWTLDATHDLARVMRLPGSVNYKAVPTPVQVLKQDGPRLKLEDILSQMPAQRFPVAAPITVNGTGHLTLDPEANPSAEKFEALLGNSPKFGASWRHERKFRDGDQSLSAYDFSLASLAAQCDWTDQETADLIVAHRRQWGGDLKLREDYYQRTIDKVKQPHATDSVFADLDAETDPPSILEQVNQIIGVIIDRMFRYDTHPVTFGCEISGRTVKLGEADIINNQSRFRNKIAGATLINLHPVSKDNWVVVAQKLLSICETIDLGEETRPVDELLSVIKDYLAESPPTHDYELETIQQKKPIYYASQRGTEEEVHIAISLPSLMAYLGSKSYRKATRSDVCVWLRDMGAYPRGLFIPHYGTYTVWMLAPELVKTPEATSAIGGDRLTNS